MTAEKILLVYSNTGAGHKSAAEAIKHAIYEICEKKSVEAPSEIILQDIVEESNKVNRLFAHMYNRLLQKHQDWMKYYITLIEWVKPNESNIGYKLSCAYTKKLITEIDPTIVVSVHPMVNHFLARTLKDLGLQEKVKLITVLTDPNANLWTGWACPDSDLTIAPNDLAYDRLITFGLDPEKIKVMGMPVQPEFLKPASVTRHELLTEYRLDPKMMTIIVSAGSAGGGNMQKIYKALAAVKKPIQVIFICGKNTRLKTKMDKECKLLPFETKVLRYATSMSEIMNSCDLLVTKAGGLTTFEAIARRLPMAIDMITTPMPQEMGTATMLIETGLAKPVRKPEDIVDIVESTEVIPDKNSVPLPSVHNLDRTDDAVYEIAETILDLCRSSKAAVK